MDIHISYWSPRFKKTVTVFIESSFLGHADAEKIKDVILKFLDDKNMDPKKLLQCSMDGPAVNLSFLRKLNDTLISKGTDPVIDIGTCTLHPVHTAVMKGLVVLGFDVDQFANDLFSWFKLSAARREDYGEVQTEVLLESAGEFFLRPVSSRWLSLEPVCRRLIEQYPALLQYFLKTLPRSGCSASVLTGDRYKRIMAALEDESTVVYLNFVASVTASLTQFLKLFQSREPLVHLLYDKLNELVRMVLMKFLKSDVVQNKDGPDLAQLRCSNADSWLSLKAIDVGVGTRKALAEVKNDTKRTELRRSFRQSYIKIATYMQSALPLQNPVLRDLSCLQPKSGKLEESKSAFSRLCLHMKKVTRTDELRDRAQGEWLLHVCDNSLDALLSEYDKTGDICCYWQKIAEVPNGTGGKQYSNLALVARAALTLAHSNAVPERGFSINNALLGKERLALDEKTIIAHRLVKDSVKLFGGVTNVPITKEMVTAARRSNGEYVRYLEEQSRVQAFEKRKREQEELLTEERRQITKKREHILQQLQSQEKLEEEHVKEQETAQELINEASKKLSAAIEKNNMQSAKVAQVMLTAGKDKLNSTTKQMQEVRVKVQDLRKKLALAECEAKASDNNSKRYEPTTKKRK